jgi:hypothetical protein
MLRRLTVENLLETYLGFGEANTKAPGAAPFALSLAIINHFLGTEWIDNHLDTAAQTSGFMRLDLRNPALGDIQLFKVIDLAELLFNLQQVAGFDVCVTQMQPNHSWKPAWRNSKSEECFMYTIISSSLTSARQ